jgi:predicted Fe-Mo cluster-binding NifX family protein
MKTAFAVWNKRIAPVFDVARRVVMVETTPAGREVQTQVLLTGDQPLQKVQQLTELGVDCLVCGAISRALQAVLRARRIRVVANLAGDLQAVIDAWRCRDAPIEPYAMPGRRKIRDRRPIRAPQKSAGTPNRQAGAGPRGGEGGRGGARRRP